jgi:hypothetical protein
MYAIHSSRSALRGVPMPAEALAPLALDLEDIQPESERPTGLRHSWPELEREVATVPAPPPSQPDPWPAIRAHGRSQRLALLTNASLWHSDQPCTPGDFCDEGSLCTRHQLTSQVAETAAALLPLFETALKQAGVDGPAGAQFVDDVTAAIRRHLLAGGEIEEVPRGR